jgi:hypothetical protein
MFKGFQNTSRSNGFNGFPALNFQMNNEAYGFSGCTFWLDAAYGTNTQTDLAAVSLWQPKIGSVLTQATASSQPRYRTSVLSGFNAVEFTAGGTKFIRSTSNFQTNNNSTVAFVATLLANLTLSSALITNAGAAAQSVLLGGTSANVTGIGVYTGSNGATTLLKSTIENTSNHIVVITKTAIIIDGAVNVTGSFNPDYYWNTIGADQVGYFHATCYVSEIVILNKYLDDTQAVTLSDRLNSKYAIY